MTTRARENVSSDIAEETSTSSHDDSREREYIRLMASTQVISEKKDEEPTVDPDLIEWEEWALVTEEHFHAQRKWQEDPLGLPMGHRKKKKSKK